MHVRACAQESRRGAETDLRKQINTPGYQKNTPANVQEYNNERLAKLSGEAANLEEQIAAFQQLLAD